MDAASNLHPPISACRFDVLVQLSRKLRPIRRPTVPSSVRVSSNFLSRMDAASGVLLCPYCSGIPVPHSCTLRSHLVPASAVCTKNSCLSGCRFSNRLLPECSDIPQQCSFTFRSPFFLPALVSRAKISEPNGCRSGIATFTFQCGVSVSLPFPSDPVIPPQYGHLHIPFAFFCAFLPRPLAIPSLPQTQFQPAACRSASGAQPLLWAQSPCLPCPQPHGPHISLGGSGLCSNLCST